MLSKLYQLADNRRAILFRNFIGMWAYYSLSPRQMRHGWQDAKDSVSLYQHGDNLANAIYHLKNQDELSYRRIVERAQILEPDLRAINFVPTPGQAPVPFIQLKDSSRGSWIGLSDGTLRVLGFATIIEQNAPFTQTQATPRSVVLIEEPENGIAPAYLRQVFEFFENVGRSQFIFTSHSPYFIDLFDADRSSVSFLRQTEGHSSIVPMSSADSIGAGDAADRLTLADLYASELL